MKGGGLICKQPSPHKYKNATVERPDIPNQFNREFDVERSNPVWCSDITYIETGKRWNYLSVVMDWFTRHIVGRVISDSPIAELTIKALDHVYHSRGKPEIVIIHSDQSVRYGSIKYRQRLYYYQMTQTMSRRGNCWDTQLWYVYFEAWSPNGFQERGIHHWQKQKERMPNTRWTTIISSGHIHLTKDFAEEKLKLSFGFCWPLRLLSLSKPLDNMLANQGDNINDLCLFYKQNFLTFIIRQNRNNPQSLLRIYIDIKGFRFIWQINDQTRHRP